jgi:hypothetical protein
VRENGVVLASAKGPAPRLVEAILGEPIQGNWWSHPRGSFIYNTLAAVQESDDILVCRLLRGKMTLIHRRLWPALVRASDCLDASRLARVSEQHTDSGRHVATEIAFPTWVPKEVFAEASLIAEDEALGALGSAVVAEVKRTKGAVSSRSKETRHRSEKKG